MLGGRSFNSIGDKGTAAYKKLGAAGRKKFGRNKCKRLLGYFAQARSVDFDPARFARMDF